MSPLPSGTTMILGLHHAQVTIPRGAEDAARAFYCGVLGLPEIEKPDSLKSRGGLWVQVGDRQLHIGTEDGVDRTRTKAHLAYEVTDIEHCRRRLTDRGIEPLESEPIEGFARFEARDPFGNRIEFIQRVRSGRPDPLLDDQTVFVDDGPADLAQRHDFYLEQELLREHEGQQSDLRPTRPKRR